MSKKPQFDPDAAHHWFGVEFNNGIFPLLEKTDRSPEETERMIAMAYASTLHWNSYSGHTSANSSRGEYMISIANAYAGRKEAALHHAKRCYEITHNNKAEMADFDFSYADMAMARAFALNGDLDSAKKFYNDCENSTENIADVKDKEIVVMDLNSGPWFGLK